MKYILRRKSVITGKANLEHLYTYKDFPVFIGAGSTRSSKDLSADLSISICKDTGIIQLDKVLPLGVVYSGYHSEALGGVWDAHHKMFLQFLNKYKLQNVLEVGGGNGKMALDYTAKHKNALWYIVEPNPVPMRNNRVKYIPKIFDSKFSLNEYFECIVHSHTIEHMYYPSDFMEKVAGLLKEGQYHLFTLPNLFEYMRKKYTNCINFEHTILLTEYFVDYLLEKFGFEILEKKYFEKHSIFYATRRVKASQPLRFRSQYAKNKKLFLAYRKYNENVINRFNKRLNCFSGDVYLFGAHVFSQYLLNQGLKGRVAGIVDNSSLKQGKRLYGTDMKIFSPKILRGLKNVAVILRAGGYQDEIRKQLCTINSNIIIWE